MRAEPGSGRRSGTGQTKRTRRSERHRAGAERRATRRARPDSYLSNPYTPASVKNSGASGVASLPDQLRNGIADGLVAFLAHTRPVGGALSPIPFTQCSEAIRKPFFDSVPSSMPGLCEVGPRAKTGLAQQLVEGFAGSSSNGADRRGAIWIGESGRRIAAKAEKRDLQRSSHNEAHRHTGRMRLRQGWRRGACR